MYKTNWQWYRERLNAAGFKSYQEYLNSDLWAKKKKQFLDYTGFVLCYVCGTGQGLQVHHRTYKRVTRENVRKDLHLICRKCHLKVHAIEKSSTTSLYHIARKLRRDKKFKNKII